ncbi:hypothetical protein HLBENOHH_01374 [Aeromonas dhakensis]
MTRLIVSPFEGARMLIKTFGIPSVLADVISQIERIKKLK